MIKKHEMNNVEDFPLGGVLGGFFVYRAAILDRFL